MLPRTRSRRSGRKPQVGAAEGDDPRLCRRPGGDRQSVGPGARAGDREPASVGRVGARRRSRRRRGQPGDPAAGGDRAAGALDVTGEGFGHRREVDHPGLRGVERREAARVRLDLSDLIGADPPQARHAVGAAPPLELVEPGQLGSLSVATISFPLRRASIPAPRSRRRGVPGALDAEPGLERARRVVDPGVDHPARVGRSGGRRAAAPARARKGSSPGAERVARGRRPARRSRRRPRRCRMSRGGSATPADPMSG